MADLGTNTSLGVALTEIEKKVVQAETDRDNLKTNLSNKGVDVNGLNKMSELVNSIPAMPVKRWASGIISSNAGNGKVYRNSGGNVIYSYFLEVNNLAFNPTVIIAFEYESGYDTSLAPIFAVNLNNKEITLTRKKTAYLKNGMYMDFIKVNEGDFLIKSNGFKIPIGGNKGNTPGYSWIAFE